MKKDKIIPGLILVGIGAFLLLRNAGVLNLHVHWENFLFLWPVFLVIGGVNLILAHNRTIWAQAIKTLVLIGGICLLLFGNFGNRYNFWPGVFFHVDRDNDDDNDNHGTITKMQGDGSFTEAYHPKAKVAQLNITGGGTVYNLSDTTNQQFEAFTKETAATYELSRTDQDSVFVLNFDMKKGSHFDWNSHNNKANTAEFKLNANPEWEINVEAGATKLDFDLQKFKIRSLEINGGAASFNVTLGQPLAETKVDVSTGAAEVRIKIPNGAACSIDTDSGLSSNHFEGFNKTDDNHYQTANFDSAKNKIIIHLDGGISDFKVSRY